MSVELEKMCNKVKTVKKFTCLGNRVSAGGGCEAVVTVRTRCGWLTLGSVTICCMERDFL